MNFSNRIDESLSFFKAFQTVITIGPRTSKIAPRSSRYPPGSRSTFREGGVFITRNKRALRAALKQGIRALWAPKMA